MSTLIAATSLNWESELAELLHRLSTAQHELLALLSMKRNLIIQRDHQGLADLTVRESELAAELQACQQRRQELLSQADAEGLPSRSIEELSAALPRAAANALKNPVAEARQRAELIRHECLAQWVAVQRTVLHLSQMLEIIATGGRSQPTYGKGRLVERGGSLIDQAV
ncbi:flagellar export chaperone FlgN [Lacipirellula sp.]|uniref:flagellar export chaperone FlgN n=1 Tax=Lacipirellula sp. TaxID=2691419 RepID=UPI003D0BBC70